MLRGLSLSVGALVCGLFASALVAGEGPTDGVCDSTGRIVCAGADAGGNVVCVYATPTSVRCDWTRGIIWTGFSRVGLPGIVEGHAVGALEVCLDQSCTTDTNDRDLPACSWLPAMDCVDGQTAGGTVGPIELAMGQCLKVTASESIQVTARVINHDLTLSQVSYANHDQGAGQECLVDNGR